MSATICLISIIIHIFSLFLIVKNWGLKSLSHPGLFFIGLWLVSTVSEWYLVYLDYTPTPYPEYIDELNVLSGYTSLCFAFASFFGRKYNNHEFLVKIVKR